jgi:hypothetical protein
LTETQKKPHETEAVSASLLAETPAGARKERENNKKQKEDQSRL